MRLVVGLAIAQLRHQRLRWGLLVLGVALVVLVPVVTAGLSRAVHARTVRQTVEGLSLTDRTILVSQEADSVLRRGTPAQDDRVVRSQLAGLTPDPVVHEMLFRPLVTEGSSYQLGGVDSLAAQVQLVSGRLPSSCAPRHCEVVIVGGTASAALARAVGTLGVQIVGRVRRESPVLVSGQLDPGSTPLLLADGTGGIAALTALDVFSRHYAWAGLIDAARVVSIGVPAFTARAQAVQAAIDARVGGTSLVTPTDRLSAADERASVSERRLRLLGAFAAVLLFGFAAVGATGLRRDAALFGQVLRRRGATGTQVLVIVSIEAVLACLLGLVTGGVAGAICVGAIWSSGTALGPVSAAGHALVTAGPAAVALTAVAAVIAAAVLLWPDTRAREVWRLVDVLALAALGAALLAGYRGAASASALAAGQDPLVTALPVLTSVIAAAVAARLWGPAVRLADRVAGERAVTVRLALAGSVRRPLRPALTAAFLTATVTAVVFAGTYRATLLANDADQAAFRVPLDATLAGTAAHPFLDADGQTLGSGVRAYGVLDATVGVPLTAGAATSVPLIAPDAAALAHAHRWQRVTGSAESAAQVARALRLDVPAGPTLPAGAHTLTVDTEGSEGSEGTDPDTAVSLWLRAPSGQQATVSLQARGDRLIGSVPDLGPGRLTVTAVGVAKSVDYASHHAHSLGEGATDQPLLTGRIVLGEVRIDGRRTAWSWAGWGSLLGTTHASSTALSLSYRIDFAPVVAVPRFAERTGRVLPVVTDPTTARSATDGRLDLILDSSTTLHTRIVATMRRAPTVHGAFVLADLQSVLSVLDLTEPGRNSDHYWVSGPAPALVATLAATGLTVTRREVLAHALDADPVGVGTRQLLLLVAALALAGGVVAIVLLVLGERRDGAHELYAWEADGTSPSSLRRVLALRAVSVVAAAVPIGLVAGLVLAVTGGRLVAVDATGTSPTPPIQVAIGGGSTMLALVVGLGGGVLAGMVTAAVSLRERLPAPAEAELR